MEKGYVKAAPAPPGEGSGLDDKKDFGGKDLMTMMVGNIRID